MKRESTTPAERATSGRSGCLVVIWHQPDDPRIAEIIMAASMVFVARARTIRRRLVHIAGSVARHARTTTVHMPEYWPWQHQWLRLWNAAHAPPA